MERADNSEKKLFDLSGKKAIVLGAGRGIGRAVALGLARVGADVGMVARQASTPAGRSSSTCTTNWDASSSGLPGYWTA